MPWGPSAARLQPVRSRPGDADPRRNRPPAARRIDGGGSGPGAAQTATPFSSPVFGWQFRYSNCCCSAVSTLTSW